MSKSMTVVGTFRVTNDECLKYWQDNETRDNDLGRILEDSRKPGSFYMKTIKVTLPITKFLQE